MSRQQEVMQTVFDNLCRCFGNPNSAYAPPRYTESMDSMPPPPPENNKKKMERRRLELRDKQWDPLFENKDKKPTTSSTASSTTCDPLHSDLDYAQALAKAKLAANPPCRRKKRKRKTTRDEIFRSKKEKGAAPAAPRASNPFSRFLGNQGVAHALCFATPIRDDDPITSFNSDGDGTLNTCEDTITSTLLFENKYAHVVENRPPMPLFTQFKLDSQEEDELRRIVATDSHSSLKMISLLNQVKSQNQQQKNPLLLEDSSDEEDDDDEEDDIKFHQGRPSDELMPEVEAATNSSSDTMQDQLTPESSFSSGGRRRGPPVEI